jgi:hypothetical protein
MKFCRFARTSRGLLLLVAIVPLSACNSKPERPAPPTYPVTGEVKTSGVQLPAGAQIEFRPAANAKADELTARGNLDTAGKFKLRVPFIDRVLPGAIEGPHTVRIVFSASNNPNSPYSSGLIEISEKFTVEPKENHFTITLPKP